MRNRFRHMTPAGWENIVKAPRDGTVVEIQNNWGIAPWFGVFKWVEGRGWVDASDPNKGCGDGDHLSWRPYKGTATAYIDPTGGAQDTNDYWIRHMPAYVQPRTTKTPVASKVGDDDAHFDAITGLMVGVLVAATLCVVLVA